jgi:hypothetical protein
MKKLKILVIFLIFARYDCVDVKEVVSDITGEKLHSKESTGLRRIRGFVGGPSNATVAHQMAINVSEHIKQVIRRHFWLISSQKRYAYKRKRGDMCHWLCPLCAHDGLSVMQLTFRFFRPRIFMMS